MKTYFGKLINLEGKLESFFFLFFFLFFFCFVFYTFISIIVKISQAFIFCHVTLSSSCNKEFQQFVGVFFFFLPINIDCG